MRFRTKQEAQRAARRFNGEFVQHQYRVDARAWGPRPEEWCGGCEREKDARRVRDAQITGEYEAGEETLEELGRKHGLTRERVRQIALAGGARPRLSARLEAQKKAAEGAEAALRAGVPWDAAVAAYAGGPVTEAAVAKGLRLRGHRPPRAPHSADRAAKYGRGRRMTERFTAAGSARSILDAYREAGGETLTAVGYADWRAAQPNPADHPTGQTVLKKIGPSWAAALARAGVPTTSSQWRSSGPRSDRAPDYWMLEWVLRAEADLGRVPSVGLYDQWRRARPEAPSSAGLRVRFRHWREVLRQAERMRKGTR